MKPQLIIINYQLIIKTICILLIGVISVRGYQGDYGTDGVFMTGAGSRADGMAGAFTAVSDDLSAIHYNPAGLAKLSKQEAAFLYYPLYESSSYGSAAYGQPLLGIGTFGAAFSRFNSGSIQGYDESGGETQVFGAEQYRLDVAYGRMILENLFAGLNVNVQYSNMNRFNYAGFGADLGVMYEPFPFLSAGLMARNLITPAFSMQSVTETMPRLYVLGIAAKYRAGDLDLMAACDVSMGEKEGFKYRTGVEVKWAGIAGVRAGYYGGEFTLGAGLAMYDARIDYAYVSNAEFGRMDRFTVSYAFGMTLEEQRLQRRREIYKEVRKIVDERIKVKIKEEADIRYSSAYTRYQSGEYEEALSEVEKALEWKKDHEPSVKMKKILEDKLKEKLGKDARAGFTGVNDGHITAGIEFYEKMQYDEAINQWEMALKSRPGNKALKALIQKAAQMRDSTRGRIKLTQEQKVSADKMYYMAVNNYTAGDLRAAIELWKKVLAINPDDVKTIRDLRKAQAELEELSKRGFE